MTGKTFKGPLAGRRAQAPPAGQSYVSFQDASAYGKYKTYVSGYEPRQDGPSQGRFGQDLLIPAVYGNYRQEDLSAQLNLPVARALPMNGRRAILDPYGDPNSVPQQFQSGGEYPAQYPQNPSAIATNANYNAPPRNAAIAISPRSYGGPNQNYNVVLDRYANKPISGYMPPSVPYSHKSYAALQPNGGGFNGGNGGVTFSSASLGDGRGMGSSLANVGNDFVNFRNVSDPGPYGMTRMPAAADFPAGGNNRGGGLGMPPPGISALKNNNNSNWQNKQSVDPGYISSSYAYNNNNNNHNGNSNNNRGGINVGGTTANKNNGNPSYARTGGEQQAYPSQVSGGGDGGGSGGYAVVRDPMGNLVSGPGMHRVPHVPPQFIPGQKGAFCGKTIMQPPGGRTTLNIFG